MLRISQKSCKEMRDEIFSRLFRKLKVDADCKRYALKQHVPVLFGL